MIEKCIDHLSVANVSCRQSVRHVGNRESKKRGRPATTAIITTTTVQDATKGRERIRSGIQRRAGSHFGKTPSKAHTSPTFTRIPLVQGNENKDRERGLVHKTDTGRHQRPLFNDSSLATTTTVKYTASVWTILVRYTTLLGNSYHTSADYRLDQRIHRYRIIRLYFSPLCLFTATISYTLQTHHWYQQHPPPAWTHQQQPRPSRSHQAIPRTDHQLCITPHCIASWTPSDRQSVDHCSLVKKTGRKEAHINSRPSLFSGYNPSAKIIQSTFRPYLNKTFALFRSPLYSVSHSTGPSVD